MSIEIASSYRRAHYAQLQTNDSHIEMTFSIDERNRLNFQQTENIFFEWTESREIILVLVEFLSVCRVIRTNQEVSFETKLPNQVP